MAHTGRCFCGQVRYTIEAEPILCGMCWCRDCQYVAGGSAAIVVMFPDEAAQFEGEIATFVKTADSGNLSSRGFCPKCATILYTRTVGPDNEPVGAPIRIRSGTLDNPDLMAPQAIVFAASAPKWAVLDPKLPQFPKAPPAAAMQGKP